MLFSSKIIACMVLSGLNVWYIWWIVLRPPITANKKNTYRNQTKAVHAKRFKFCLIVSFSCNGSVDCCASVDLGGNVGGNAIPNVSACTLIPCFDVEGSVIVVVNNLSSFPIADAENVSDFDRFCMVFFCLRIFLSIQSINGKLNSLFENDELSPFVIERVCTGISSFEKWEKLFLFAEFLCSHDGITRLND